MAEVAATPAAAPKRGGRTKAAAPAAAPTTPAEEKGPAPDPVKPADPVVDQGGPKAEPGDGGKPPVDPDPVIDNPAPTENDAEFVLRVFGVQPSKYVKDGALDRAALQNDVETRRPLFANRVLHRRSA